MQKTLFWLALLSANLAWAVSPAEMLKSYEAASGKASSQRGEQLFNNKHGKEWSCSSCHTARPNKTTEHIVTGKSIEALAPSANANRFTDTSKTEKWFKRNCKDVFSRECTAQEKADIVAWLLTVK
jgi:cytochrome c553